MLHTKTSHKKDSLANCPDYTDKLLGKNFHLTLSHIATHNYLFRLFLTFTQLYPTKKNLSTDGTVLNRLSQGPCAVTV